MLGLSRYLMAKAAPKAAGQGGPAALRTILPQGPAQAGNEVLAQAKMQQLIRTVLAKVGREEIDPSTPLHLRFLKQTHRKPMSQTPQEYAVGQLLRTPGLNPVHATMVPKEFARMQEAFGSGGWNVMPYSSQAGTKWENIKGFIDPTGWQSIPFVNVADKYPFSVGLHEIVHSLKHYNPRAHERLVKTLNPDYMTAAANAKAKSVIRQHDAVRTLGSDATGREMHKFLRDLPWQLEDEAAASLMSSYRDSLGRLPGVRESFYRRPDIGEAGFRDAMLRELQGSNIVTQPEDLTQWMLELARGQLTPKGKAALPVMETTIPFTGLP